MMNYPYSVTPNIQAAMAQAMQAIMTGGPLPPHCFVITIPIQQAQQMFPQLMLNYASGGAMYPQQFGQMYQPQINPYQSIQAPSNAIVPYSNYYSQGYNNPVVPYNDYNNRSKKKSRYGKRDPSQPHSNVYNSSSFDTHMDNLSWSRLFGHRHSKRQNQGALSYEQKPNPSKKRQNHSPDSFTSTTSSSTTSDETIRRVNVALKPPTGSTSSKQQPKGSLPFKYSSEFVPGTGKQQPSKSTKKDSKIKPDDVFVVKKTEQSQTSSQQ